MRIARRIRRTWEDIVRDGQTVNDIGDLVTIVQPAPHDLDASVDATAAR